ncbi:MAG: hypothetical protein M9958_07505 [Chitinophagales bacterium]|nr:hypothetical protein [Chitinophagales bacterium]
MRKLVIIVLCIISFSCKKDEDKDFQENISVQITKVEQTESPNTFPFRNFSLDNVNYIYQDNVIKSISIKGDAQEAISIDITSEKNQYFGTFSQNAMLSDPLSNSITMKSFKIIPINNSLSWMSNEYSVVNPFNSEISTKNRTITYEYDKSRVLKELKSVFKGSDGAYFWNGEGTNLKIKEMNGDLVSRYTVFNRLAAFSEDIKSGQDLEITLQYQYVPEIPDGLVNIVNQAIMGVYHLGFEDYYFSWPYYLNKDNHISLAKDFPTEFNGTRYVFADWIIGFAFPQLKFFPTSKNQLIVSKHIQGKSFSAIDSIDSSLVYNRIDSVVNYPYVFDSVQKTLEIAGLKIYYKVQ